MTRRGNHIEKAINEIFFLSLRGQQLFGQVYPLENQVIAETHPDGFMKELREVGDRVMAIFRDIFFPNGTREVFLSIYLKISIRSLLTFCFWIIEVRRWISNISWCFVYW
ncbi:hypothetical protein QW180_05905 [Vibrio sinaloensis]|nr:hypothetical protein [Vibrio sinaloensis]